MVSPKDRSTPKELKLKELKPSFTAGNISTALETTTIFKKVQGREELESFQKEVKAFIEDKKVFNKILGVTNEELFFREGNYYNMKLLNAYQSHVAHNSDEVKKKSFIQEFVKAFPKEIENIAKDYIKGKEKEQMSIIKKIGAKIKSSMSKTKLEMGSKAKAPTKTKTGMQKRRSIEI